MDNQEKIVPQLAQEDNENLLNLDEEQLEGVTGGRGLVDFIKQCFGCGSGNQPKLGPGEYVMYDPEQSNRPLSVSEGKEYHKNIVQNSPQHPGWEVRGERMDGKTVAVSYPFNVS
jgi:hypothetical protein